MRRISLYPVLLMMVTSGICLAQSGQNLIVPTTADTAHPSPYNLDGAKYARIETDGRVTFRFNAPYAKNVQVAIANVAFHMIKGDDGVWTYTSEPQDKGYHNYWMLVDSAL